VHFICHRTHLVEETFSLFIDNNYSGTNKLTIIGVASYGALGHVTLSTSIYFSWSLQSRTNSDFLWLPTWKNMALSLFVALIS